MLRSMLLFAMLLHLALFNAIAQDLSGKSTQAFSLSGSLVSAAENYSIPGLGTHRPVNSARLYFNPTLNLYGLQLPFSFLLSTHERSYNQPFNQFGVSPTYGGLTLHAGHRSLRFSEFTLNDAVILGGGAEFRADRYRLRSMYGRLRRSVQEDSNNSVRPVYERWGWAFGAGYSGESAGSGSESASIDINVMKAWDEAASLSSDPTAVGVYPAENVVAGLNGRLPLAEGKVVLDAELAGSVFTRDFRQDVVEDVFAPTLGLTEPRLSSRFTIATRTGAVYNAALWSLRLEYARVEPEYETMGSLYTQNDYQDITIKPAFRLPGGNLRLSASAGIRKDNLFGDRLYTTNRIIGSGMLNWMPDPVFGIDANYSNYSMSNSTGVMQINDNTHVNNVSESWSISPRLMLLSRAMQHFIMLFSTRQLYTDRNIVTGMYSDNDVFTAVLSYTGTLASGFGFSGAFQFTQLNTAFLVNIIRGYTIEVNNAFFENALHASLAYTLNFTRASNESATDTQHLLTLSTRYRFSRTDALEFRFQFNDYHAVDPSRRSYQGSISRLQYSRSFAFGQ